MYTRAGVEMSLHYNRSHGQDGWRSEGHPVAEIGAGAMLTLSLLLLPLLLLALPLLLLLSLLHLPLALPVLALEGKGVVELLLVPLLLLLLPWLVGSEG